LIILISDYLERTFLDEETRRFGEDGKTSAENECPEELNGDGDSVRSGIQAVLGCVDNAGGEQNADRNAELVTGNNSATNFLRSNLRHIPVEQVRI